MKTFMVKIKKKIKPHNFINILELSWDFSRYGVGIPFFTPSPHYSHNNTLITTMNQLKNRCIMREQFNDIDEIMFETGGVGFSIIRSSPHFHTPRGLSEVLFGYVNGVKVVYSQSDEAKICLKHKDKIIGEIKILNYG